MTLPAAAWAILVYLGSSVPEGNLRRWFAAITALSILGTTAAYANWKSTTRGRQPRFEWVITCCMLGLGVAVGLSEMLLPVPPGHREEAIVIQLFISGVAGAAVLTFGPNFRNFVAFQGPMHILNALCIVLGYNRIPMFIAPVASGYLVMLAGAHLMMSRAVSEAFIGEARVERLLEALELQSDRVAMANDALEKQASHDPLTGVANRVRFLEQLAVQLAGARRRGDLVAVLFIDLDHFKKVNDAYGHAAGDAVLIEMARRIQAEIRSTDLVARHGGDEFTVLLASPETSADAVEVADRLCRRLGEPFVIGNEELHLSASVGLALNDDLESDPDTLMRNADLALYRAKSAGRNRVEILDITLRSSIANRRAEEAEIRRALVDGEIVPWFQPVIDIRSGNIVGAEALARWVHPSRGVLGPASFLPLIREYALDDELAASIVLPTLATLRILEVETTLHAGFRISVNIDDRRSTLTRTVERLEAAAAAGQPVSRLVLELTENAVMRETSTIDALERARSLGISIALDDFGTGESPLSLVRDLPLDIIKIDRRFVHGMLDHQADLAVVAAVIELSRLLGVTVIAEGVEEELQAQRLLELGCRYAQGFHYAPAIPLAQLVDFMQPSSLQRNLVQH